MAPGGELTAASEVILDAPNSTLRLEVSELDWPSALPDSLFCPLPPESAGG